MPLRRTPLTKLIEFADDMKRIFTLLVLMSLGMICSCHKQDSSAEQEFTQRKAELDGREQALGERVNGLEERMNELDKRMSALAEREIRNADVTTPAAQSQPVIRDPAQVQPEVDSGIQPTPAEAHGLIGDPLQSDPEKAEKDRIRNQLAPTRRGLEDQQSRRLRKLEQSRKWRTSQAAVTPETARSPTPSPGAP